MKQKLILLFSLALLNSCWANASETKGEEKTKKADLGGSVVHGHTGKPLQSVVVKAFFEGKETVVLTDASGAFTFNELKKGTYKFVFIKDGYKKVTKEKMLSREDGLQLLHIRMEEEEESFDFTPGHNHFFDL